MPGLRYVSPSIVGIGNDLYPVFVIDSNNVTKQILFKEESVEQAFCHAGLPVLHADGCARLVVQVNQGIIAPSFADDLRAVECVDVLNGAYFFTCSDAFVVVLKSQRFTAFGGFGKLTTILPFKGIGRAVIILQRVAQRIIFKRRRAVIVVQAVAVITVRYSRFERGRCSSKRILIRTLFGAVARAVVRIKIRFVQVRVILANQLPDVVVFVPYDGVRIFR